MDKEPQLAYLTYIIYSLLENKDPINLSELTHIPIAKIQLWMNKFNWEHREHNLFANSEILKSSNPYNVILNFFEKLVSKIEDSNNIISSLELDEVLKLLPAISRMLPIVNKISGNNSPSQDLSREDEIFIANFIAKPEALNLAHQLLNLLKRDK